MAEDKDKKKKSKVKAHLKDLEKGNYVKKSWDSSPSWNQNRAPEKMMKYNRVGSPGSKKTNEELKRATKGSVGDMELRYKTGKSAAQLFDATDKSHRVPNKALAKKTEDFGSMGKKTYYSGNPGGLKKGSGKSVSSMKTPERSTRSKIGGAIKKGKQAIRKINNKAGAVKNKAEAKVVAGAKKVAGAVKSANYKAGAVKNKAEEKVLKKIKKK